ncbi:MAG: phosphatidate cytidylyltransferase [Ruminococcaceae bacterium]|nr:phosphatidate cytidylyltransferase [Oscillospiraceae bacterium]
MLKRILTSIVAILILVPVLFLSDTVVFPIALALVSLICLYELFKCTGIEKAWTVTVPLYLFSLILPFLVRYMDDTVYSAMIAFMVAVVYVIYLFTLIVWSGGKLAFGETSAVVFMAMYILLALSSILYVRDFEPYGVYIYLLIFIGAWVTDIFAYFTGYFLGKHKLIEAVSPKKTVEGSIGGIVFCAASFALFGWIVDQWFGQDANLLFLVISGVILSLIAQIGDLIMSVIKRHYGIKDFGKLFPGHGGMLDRFDSILAVSLGLGAICVFVSLSGIQLM